MNSKDPIECPSCGEYIHGYMIAKDGGHYHFSSKELHAKAELVK